MKTTRQAPLAPAAATLVAALLLAATPAAHAAKPTELLAAYSAKAGQPASAERGQAFFNQVRKNDFDWSCASCHTENPAKSGRDATSDKRIAPLAPAANPARFTDAARVESWFRNNCKDVVGRECTAAEKADVIAWLLTVKP